MLKVLIIDDERNIRENLKTLIDWEEIGYTICGEADNGDDGLRKHNVLKPHLVIADIRMPGLHGLDMIKAIKKENKDIRSLIMRKRRSITGWMDISSNRWMRMTLEKKH